MSRFWDDDEKRWRFVRKSKPLPVAGDGGPVTVPDGSITADKLANGSVTATKLANSTITSTQIAPNGVSLDRLARADLIRNYPLAGNANGFRATDGGVTNFNAVNGAATIQQLFFYGKADRYYIKAFYRRHSGNNTRGIEIWDKDNQDFVRFNAPGQFDSNNNIIYPSKEVCPLTDSTGAVRGHAVITWAIAPNIADYTFADTELHASCFVNTVGLRTNLQLADDYGASFTMESVYRLTSGHEFNLYFDAISVCKRPADIYYKVTSPTLTAPVIKHFDECIRITPTDAQIGTHTINVEMRKITTGEVVVSGSTTVNVRADAVLASPLKVMFLGDSLTESGAMITAIKDGFGENITLYGTQGTDPYKHEGRSAWSANDYLTLASKGGRTNPFFNASTSRFDFAHYMANNPGFADVQVVNVFLGRNDGYTATAASRIKTIVDSIKAFNSNIVVTVMMGYHTADTNGGAGAQFQNTWDYRNGTFVINGALRSTFGGQESSRIYLVPQYVNLDTHWDYPHTMEQVSARNTDTVYRVTDNVHPNDFGLQKFADVWYSYMQYIRAQLSL